jgi:hypothetical protein
MKKLLILSLCCGLFCSCAEREFKEVDGRQVEIIDKDSPYTIRYVEFDGHEYVYMSQSYGRSLCHSPKCSCLNEYKNED